MSETSPSETPTGRELRAGMAIPVVPTERLVLCALTDAHLDDYTRMAYDARVAEWFGGLPDPPHTTQRQREEMWRHVAMLVGHWALRGHGQWAIVERTTGRFLGRAGLWQPEGWPGVEVGWLVDPDRWGEGIASEAGRASLDWAFTTLDLDEVISVTLPHNAASRRVMEKVGLTDTGQRRELGGHTQVLYRTTREEWNRA